jgi:hypothetical protein
LVQLSGRVDLVRAAINRPIDSIYYLNYSYKYNDDAAKY